MESVLNKVKRWYNGTPVVFSIPSHKNENVVFLGTPFSAGTKYHWTAKVARASVKFYLKNWQWVWATLVAVIFGILALL